MQQSHVQVILSAEYVFIDNYQSEEHRALIDLTSTLIQRESNE